LWSISCKTNHKSMPSSESNETELSEEEFTPNFGAGSPVLIYKTKADYNNLVPVILSDDKKEIISYSHPNDLKSGNTFLQPLTLHDGYLLDNKGIGKNVAFLKINYEDYSKLSEVPTLKELHALIIDKDPLIELCDCGVKNAFTNIEK